MSRGDRARAERPPGADLRRLLAEQGRPDAELTLALQGDRLGVDPADDDEVAVQGLDLVGGQVEGVVGMICPFALGGEELDEFFSRIGLPVQAVRFRCGDRTVCVDGHVPLLALGTGPRITVTGRSVSRFATAGVVLSCAVYPEGNTRSPFGGLRSGGLANRRYRHRDRP